jgi:hypothetical protein
MPRFIRRLICRLLWHNWEPLSAYRNRCRHCGVIRLHTWMKSSADQLTYPSYRPRWPIPGGPFF